MRALLIVSLAACGGAQNPSDSGTKPAAAVAQYPALRWAPDAPSYVIAAPTVRDGQRAIRDVIDSFGLLAHATPDDVSAAARAMIGLDPLGPELGAKLGVDLDGGIAVFSEGVSPTFVVHLAAPAVTRAFFDQLRTLGMHSTPAVVDGTEISTARLRDDISASWAIEGDWFWFHVTFAGFAELDGPANWFGGAHQHRVASWTDAFSWAARFARAAKPLVGFWNSHALLARIANTAGHEHFLADGMACIGVLATVERVGISVEGDGHHAGGKLAFDVGPSAPKIASSILPPPPGFAALAANAPLAVQWNVDLEAISSGLAPCLRALGTTPDELAKTGVRSARGVLETFDPDAPSGTGAVALDLSSRTQVGKLIDEIPRLAIQSDRTFGPYHGRHVSIPFVAALDYVLDEKIGLAAMGDGLLDQLVAGAPGQNAPLFAIDIRPPGLSEHAWQVLFTELAGKRRGEMMTSQLEKWRDGHISVSLDQDALVLDASGDRR
jgi:hypothetical protein